MGEIERYESMDGGAGQAFASSGGAEQGCSALNFLAIS